VAIDNVASARDVVRHLVQGGRRRIAFLGNQPDRPSGVGGLRYRGYREEMDAAGLAVHDVDVSTALHFTREEGQARAVALLSDQRPVDALICASDLLAIGAMRALRELGMTAGPDVAVVGWDNTVDAAYHVPSLTSVAPALSQLAELALDALVNRIEGNRAPGVSYLVPHELVVRESSAPVRRT